MRRYIPVEIGVYICFAVLLVIGGIKLFQSLSKRSESNGDALKTLKPAEAVVLAAGLSVDGLAVGFGAALGNANVAAIIILSLFTDVFAIILGCYAGRKLVQRFKCNVSWLGGAVLIILAFTKLL
ncbi:MAG: manganese efflux pump [Oscillospiraceae bacterium]|nr:manganese efflux pump [Oscillospiraceae bacterium]